MIRALKSRPGFAALIVLALGLGIGTNTTLFTVVDAALLRPFPYQEPEQLVMISETSARGERDVAPANFLDWKDKTRSITAAAAIRAWGFALRSAGEPQNVFGFRVSLNLFDVLGVPAALGRTFVPGEDRAVVLSHGYWLRTSGDPEIIGRTLVIDHEPYTVVGVLPPGFSFVVRDAELWVPLRFTPDELRRPGGSSVRVVARLQPGVTPAQAQAELTATARRIEQQFPSGAREPGMRVLPLAEALRPNSAPTLLMLLAASGFVLLITCANVANLLLVQSAARRREFAIRAAVGAGRARIVRQLLAESATLTALGAALGLLLSHWTLGLVTRTMPNSRALRLPGGAELGIDHRVLLFAAAVALLTVVVCALAPALRASRVDLLTCLKDSARGSGGLERQRLARALVVAEIALALPLLVGGGLMVRSLFWLEGLHLGFHADSVLRASVFSYSQPRQRVAVIDQVVERVAALPGVQSVGVLSPQFFPFGGPRVRGAIFQIQGQPAGGPSAEPRAETYIAGPGYFHTMRIPLLKGRIFSPSDSADAPPVAVVSHIVAHRYWPGEDPIGRLIRLDPANPDSPWLTIVGVVGDTRNPLAPDWQPTVYRPYAQSPPSAVVLMIRTSVDPLSLAPAVRKEMQLLNPDAPVRTARLEQAVSAYLSDQRFSTSLLGFFAALGLLLAALGVYGVMHYWVTQRVHDIGVRMALGAGRGAVLRLVIGHGAAFAGLGIAIGLGASFGLTRLIASELYGVSPTDPPTFVALALGLGAVTLLAAYLPARRATRVDPMVALRHE